jgi:PilZ domain
MIAPWLQDLLVRERNWRGTLRRLSSEWAQRRDRSGSLAEVGRALEHVEPDRRFAVVAYQNAGPEVAAGRALDLALELGWWSAVVPLATQERSATGSIEALVWEGRALIDQREVERADRLIPSAPDDPRVAALRAELAGGSAKALAEWQACARSLTGSEAAEAYLITARLSRVLGHPDWEHWLELATQADPSHLGAVSMLCELRLRDDDDSKRLLAFVRTRLEIFDRRDDVAAWCDAVRHISMRLWFREPEGHHRGLARRLLTAAIERAYRDGLVRIPGHLAMWALLDEGASGDHTRPELLPLVIAGLEAQLPVFDRVWLAALGAEICAAESNLSAAHAYAAVVAEHAPLHPVVRAWFAGTVAEQAPQDDQLDSFRDALLQLEVEACQELQIEEIAPIEESDDLELAAPGFSTISMRPVLIEPTGDPHPRLDVAVGGSTPHARRSPIEEPAPAPPPRRALGTVDEAITDGPAPTAPRWAAPPEVLDAALLAVEAELVPCAGDDEADRGARVSAEDPVDAAPPPAPAASTSSSMAAWSPAGLSRERARSNPVVVSVGFHGVDGAWGDPSPSIQARRRATEMGPLALRPPAVAARAAAQPVSRPPRVTVPGAPAAVRLASAAPAIQPSSGASAPAPAAPAAKAPAPRPPGAPSTATRAVAAPGAAKPLIPTTALRAISGAAQPKPLPKPPPPPQARPRAHRVTVSMDLRLLIAGQALAMQSRDVSSTGFFAVTSHDLPIGEVVECELRVPARGLVEQTFRVKVRIVRRSDIGYGFELVAPSASLVAALNELSRA